MAGLELQGHDDGGTFITTAQHWSGIAVVYLKRKITGNRVRVKIVSATQTAFLVKLFDPDCTRKMLNVTMYQLGYA